MDPGQNLNDVTQARPAGTVFWLAPGTHTLGSGEFAQIIPKDDNTYVGAPGAVLDGRHLNRYAFTQQATGVTIKHLTITNFVSPPNEGVVNGSSSRGWKIERNTISGNRGAGAFVGSDGIISYNCLDSNGQYGLSGYRPPVKGAPGITNVVVDHNEISRNNTDDWETKIPGCGCTGGAKFWDIRGARITNNYVHHNKSVGLWADTNNVDFLIDGNYISDNDSMGIWYEISYNAHIQYNTLIRNSIETGRDFRGRGDGFPIGAIYIAESGGDGRASPNRVTLSILGNRLEDNWGGVVLWEAAERFCNSQANTSSGYCTKVNPEIRDTSACNRETIAREPYYSDCRWKTQNVLVEGNILNIDKAALNCTDYCGVNAMHSNYGQASPPWSPYTGNVVNERLVFNSNNVWRNNKYVGDWKWRTYVRSSGSLEYVSWDAWRAAPYNQDSGSLSTNNVVADTGRASRSAPDGHNPA